MTVFSRFEDIALAGRALHLAIGVFDGVHLGHQTVLRSAVEAARATSGSSLMVTFEPHPVRVLRPAEAPALLTSLKHKLKLAALAGMETALVVPFNRDFSQSSAPQFVESLLSGGAEIRSVSVGQDWRFGCDRSGDLDALQAIGARHGFAVHGLPPLLVDGQIVSSTQIRSLIQAGSLDAASRYLGRLFSVLGTVERGRQLGRTLGFPTANIDCAELQLPPPGVYAGRATLAHFHSPAVVNLGRRPTVSGSAEDLQLEVHLLDYAGPEFYGDDLEIEFILHLRDERKFESVSALSEQIRKDARRARELLERSSNP